LVRSPWKRDGGRSGQSRSGEDAEKDLQRRDRSIHKLSCYGVVRDVDPAWIFEHHHVGVAQDGQSGGIVFSQSQGAGDLVAVGGALVESINAAYGDPLRPQELENIGGRRADGMDKEIVWSDSGNVRECCVPSQRIEVEARVVIDHAAEPSARRAGSLCEGRRCCRTAVRGQVVRFSGSGFDMVKLSMHVVSRPH
jgi:hypothetical protein